MSDSKLHYIIHVQPTNLRLTESTLHDAGAELFYPPVWVVRPECAKDRSALVYAWTVIGGSVKSHSDPYNPLPDTGGHGWAYIECDTLLVRTKRTDDSDAWIDAAYLFTGVCSPLPSTEPFTPYPEPKADDDTSDADNLYSPGPSDVDDHGSTYNG